MHRLTYLISLLALALGIAVAGTGGVAAAPPATCTATLTIATTSPGAVTTTGQVVHVRDSGVGGAYTAGFLAGSTIVGSQDIMVNQQTNQSELHGSYVATGPGGTLAIRYTGHADLTTGAATGHFETQGGTGQFAGFHWAGEIAAQLVSLAPPTFVATDSGTCHPAS
jgi:hypothetical protein